MEKPEYCKECSWLFDKMGACQPPDASIIFSLISFIPYLIIFLFLGLALIIRTHKQVKMAILLVSCYIVGDRILKNLIQSLRPEGACKSSFGFPSSHMTVMCCYTLGIWLECRKSQKIFLIVLVVLQAFARVQLKYHTWEQVIGGVIFSRLYEKVASTQTYKEYCSILKIKM